MTNKLTKDYTTDTLKGHLVQVVDGSDNFDEMLERIAVYIMSDWELRSDKNHNHKEIEDAEFTVEHS